MIILIICFFIIIEICISRAVLGKYISDNEISKLQNKLSLPCIYSKGLINWWHYDFAAKHFSILSRWYIQGVGQIPRWSKMNKLLDEKYNSLKKTVSKDMTDVRLSSSSHWNKMTA